MELLDGSSLFRIRPVFLTVNGRPEFVVLRHADYQRMLEAIEDTADLSALRRARRADAGKPLYTVEQVRAGLGRTGKRRATRRR
jgi:PHD/YefM family antitoxin component YafN of YafNO toxin-antitoxin module